VASSSSRSDHLKLVYSRRDQPRILSIAIPGGVHHRLKNHALRHDQSLKELVTEILATFVVTQRHRS
jgi:predicted HicB family RNase H-like nuclease